MRTSPPRLWDGVLRRLGAEIPPFTLEAWIGSLAPRVEDDRLVLACPTGFHRERVRERFLAAIERCVAEEAGEPVEVSLVVSPAPLPASSQHACAGEAAAGPAAAAVAAPAIEEPPPERVERASRPATQGRTQPELPYRFDNFVVGACNALAREAAVAVAQGTQRGLNPLVLASPSGLGKTHLARAIVAEARSLGEERAIYASAEAFTNEFTGSLRARRAEQFKRRYRQGCRLLVLEDVQFFDARKKATQLEIFHTLSHLLDVGARVVFTADRLPRDLEGLDPRLRSKLSSGLVAELDAPDAVVRRDILRHKAAAGGVRLPDDCRELLVECVRGSVRDLEGALSQVVAMSSLLKRPIDTDLTLAALRKVSPGADAPRRIEVRDVVEAVASFFQKRPDELAARSRRRDVLVPRQLAMFLCRRYTDAPLAAIGAALGRDHSAVANAVRVVERAMLERVPLRYQVEALSARLDGLVQGRR